MKRPEIFFILLRIIMVIFYIRISKKKLMMNKSDAPQTICEFNDVMPRLKIILAKPSLLKLGIWTTLSNFVRAKMDIVT